MNSSKYNKIFQYMFEPSDSELKILIDLAKQLTTDPSENPNEFCKQAKKISDRLPIQLKKVLKEFIKVGNDNEFLLITGLEKTIENLVETPSNNSSKMGEKTNLAKIQAICLSYMSEMIAYEAEGYGRLFQDMVPIKSMEREQTSVGSTAELEIHTEQAFSDLKPDILSLACLRGDANALTFILPVKKIIDNLSSDEVTLLKQPLWKTGVDLSFKISGHEFKNGDIRGPMPILSRGVDISRPILTFDQDLMFGITPRSSLMIKKVVDIYYENRISHNLKPGQIIFINNRHAVHGRSPFFPKYDGLDRFLVRCFSVLDYMKSNLARPYESRTVSAIYS
jgi:L-asparagine oxygenase